MAINSTSHVAGTLEAVSRDLARVEKPMTLGRRIADATYTYEGTNSENLKYAEGYTEVVQNLMCTDLNFEECSESRYD